VILTDRIHLCRVYISLSCRRITKVPGGATARLDENLLDQHPRASRPCPDLILPRRLQCLPPSSSNTNRSSLVRWVKPYLTSRRPLHLSPARISKSAHSLPTRWSLARRRRLISTKTRVRPLTRLTRLMTRSSVRLRHLFYQAAMRTTPFRLPRQSEGIRFRLLPRTQT
jgi:hypothetical protein